MTTLFVNISDEVASKSKKFEVDKICNCLPSCVSVQYDAEILKTTFDFKKDLMVRMRKYNDSNKKPSFTHGFWDEYVDKANCNSVIVIETLRYDFR